MSLIFTAFSTHAHAESSISCLKTILQDQDFANNAHHPQKYFFSRAENQSKEFYLIGDQKSFFCRTTLNFETDSTLEIKIIPAGTESTFLIYFSKIALRKAKPQTKSASVPIIDGFLPVHQIQESATDIDAVKGKKIVAICSSTSDQRLIQQQITNLARLEIQDLFADFGESRDGIAYNYDVKEKEKNQWRKEYDLKLKNILELCKQVPELKSVSESVAAKIQLKSDLDFKVLESDSDSGIKSSKKNKPATAVTQ